MGKHGDCSLDSYDFQMENTFAMYVLIANVMGEEWVTKGKRGFGWERVEWQTRMRAGIFLLEIFNLFSLNV